MAGDRCLYTYVHFVFASLTRNAQVPQDLLDTLRHVNRATDRVNATGEQLEGDLQKGLFLAARVFNPYSDCHKSLNVDIPGLVPNHLTAHGRTNFVLPPTKGHVVPISQEIMHPNNIFTKYMYQHEQKCDLKALNQQVRFDLDEHKQFAGMFS